MYPKSGKSLNGVPIYIDYIFVCNHLGFEGENGKPLPGSPSDPNMRVQQHLPYANVPGMVPPAYYAPQLTYVYSGMPQPQHHHMPVGGVLYASNPNSGQGMIPQHMPYYMAAVVPNMQSAGPPPSYGGPQYPTGYCPPPAYQGPVQVTQTNMHTRVLPVIFVKQITFIQLNLNMLVLLQDGHL